MSAPPTDRIDPARTQEEVHRSLTGARRARRVRGLQVGIVASVAIAAIFLVSVGTGEFRVSPIQVIQAMFGTADPMIEFIVQTLRLPRALTALVVGFGFGMAGAIFQSLLRNPLASPDILGITSGASLAAVFLITATAGGASNLAVMGGDAVGFLPAGAIIGATVTALLMYVLAYRHGVSPYRLILIGIGIGATAAALIDFLLTRVLEEGAARAFVWLTGSLNSRTWEHLLPAVIGLVILVPIALFLNARLRMLQLGDDTAAGLGVSVERMRLALLMVGVGLVGISVAAAGPVAFVSLLAPPIARRVARSPGPALLLSGLAGATLVAAADLAAQNLFTNQIPVGIVTGVIGAPYMLWLLARSNRIGRGG